MKNTIVMTHQILGDFFFSSNHARLYRFVQHWVRAVEQNDPTYIAYPEDDNDTTRALASRCGWIARARDDDWYLTGPEKNHIWLRCKPEPVSTYVVEAVGEGLVKIGRSRDPWARLASLKTGNARELRMVAVLVGDIEASLHRRHATDRVNGEWFRFSQAIRDSIASLDKVPPWQPRRVGG